MSVASRPGVARYKRPTARGNVKRSRDLAGGATGCDVQASRQPSATFPGSRAYYLNAGADVQM
jgi:hypothetical protein